MTSLATVQCTPKCTFMKPALTALNSSVIIACKFHNGVIIGADSQRTSGDYINNRTASKLIKVNDRIYCSGSGSEADIQFITDVAIYQLHALKLNTGEVSVAAAAALLRKLCYRNRDNFDVEFLVVGWDHLNEEGQLYSISSGGMMKPESVCAIGSGSLYVYGYIDAVFKADLDRNEAEALVMKTLELATSRDNLSGGNRNVIILPK